MWDLIVSVPDHCLSLYFTIKTTTTTCVLILTKCFFYKSSIPDFGVLKHFEMCLGRPLTFYSRVLCIGYPH